MSRDVRVLIMDEPTAALSAFEVQRLFRQVRRLAAAGVAILFVSHRLDEVFELSDRITVFRDGTHISTKPAGEVTEATLIRDMVGRELTDFFQRVPHDPGEVALRAVDLGRRGAFHGVSFEVREGEVLGFAGLVGSGRTEVAEALFGVAPAHEGSIERAGKVVTIRSPRDAMSQGIAYVSEDRRRLGLSLPQSITANVTLPGLRRFVSRWGLVDRGAERAAAAVYRERLGIKAPSLSTPVGNLSGGNQQKVMLAKWLDVKPAVLILDEPTRGVDVGAKADIHELVGELARAGVAVILISSDLPEVLAMSDRVLVMREGRQMGVFAGADLQQERIMTAAVGVAMSTISPTAVAVPVRTRVRRQGLRPERIKELSLLGVLIASVLVFSIVVEDYLSARFVSRLLIAISITAILAAGESIVIITRNIDLSVGAIVGVSAYLTSEYLSSHGGLPAVAAVTIAVGIGLALGLVNGVLVAIANVPSIIVTLGTLAIFRSLLVGHAGGATIATGDLPEWLINMPRSTVFTIGGYEVRTMFVLALVDHRGAATRAAVHAGGSADLRRGLEPGGRPPGRPARAPGAADGVRRLRRPRRVRRLLVRRAVRHDQRHRRLRPRARRHRRRRRRRREHARRIRNDLRRVPRGGADRGARPEPGARRPDQRVLAGRDPGRPDRARRAARRGTRPTPPSASPRPDRHRHGGCRRCLTGPARTPGSCCSAASCWRR